MGMILPDWKGACQMRQSQRKRFNQLMMPLLFFDAVAGVLKIACSLLRRIEKNGFIPAFQGVVHIIAKIETIMKKPE
jgi:hypothetical protein